MTLSWEKSTLPTDRALLALVEGGGTRWALAANPTERELGSPGSVVLAQAPGGRWEVHTTFDDLALRTLWALPSGELWAGGVAGACVRFDGQRWQRWFLPGRPNLHRVWGSSPQHLVVVGDDLWSFFDGSTWHPLDLASLLPGERPTLLEVHGVGSESWAVGTGLHEPFVLRHRPGLAPHFRQPLPSFYLYAVCALGDGRAWVLANDGLWELENSSPPSRRIDFRSSPVRPFGPPAFVANHQGRSVIASVDGVGVLQSLLTEQERLASRAFHLWVDGVHRHCRLDAPSGISYLGFARGRVLVGLPGALWEAPLEA